MLLWTPLALASPAIDGEAFVGAAGSTDPFLVEADDGLGVLEGGARLGLAGSAWTLEGEGRYDLAMSPHRVGDRGRGALSGWSGLGDEALGIDLRLDASVDSNAREILIDRPRQPFLADGGLSLAPHLRTSAVDLEGELVLHGLLVGDALTPFATQRRADTSLAAQLGPGRVELGHQLAGTTVQPFFAGVKSKQVHLGRARIGLQPRETPIYSLRAVAGAAVVSEGGQVLPEAELSTTWHAGWLSTRAAVGLAADTPWFATWSYEAFWERGFLFEHPELGPSLEGSASLVRHAWKADVDDLFFGGTRVGVRGDFRLALGWGRERMRYELYGEARLSSNHSGSSENTVALRDYQDLRAGVRLELRPGR